MDIDLVPTSDRLIVQVEREGEYEHAGIVIPDIGEKRPDRGIVLAVGPGMRYGDEIVPVDVEPGDRVVFTKYGGTEIKHAGEPLLIVRESDLLARIAE